MGEGPRRQLTDEPRTFNAFEFTVSATVGAKADAMKLTDLQAIVTIECHGRWVNGPEDTITLQVHPASAADLAPLIAQAVAAAPAALAAHIGQQDRYRG